MEEHIAVMVLRFGVALLALAVSGYALHIARKAVGLPGKSIGEIRANKLHIETIEEKLLSHTRKHAAEKSLEAKAAREHAAQEYAMDTYAELDAEVQRRYNAEVAQRRGG